MSCACLNQQAQDKRGLDEHEKKQEESSPSQPKETRQQNSTHPLNQHCTDTRSFVTLFYHYLSGPNKTRIANQNRRWGLSGVQIDNDFHEEFVIFTR